MPYERDDYVTALREWRPMWLKRKDGPNGCLRAGRSAFSGRVVPKTSPKFARLCQPLAASDSPHSPASGGVSIKWLLSDSFASGSA